MPRKSALTLVLLALLFNGGVWAGGKEKILYSFSEGPGSGYRSGVISDSAGDLFGTILTGGGSPNCPNGCGTVYELVPSNGHWTQKVLHSFGLSDGAYPGPRLVMDADGNLYGTASAGGAGDCSGQGCGLIFELTPNPDGSWTETVLYGFQGSDDGYRPYGLASDGKGNFFGIMAVRAGAVFELTPPSEPGGTWSESVVYAFKGNSDFDGDSPDPTITIDSAGHLYGTTSSGGGTRNCVLGCGTVYKLKRVNGQWSEIFYTFKGGGNGFSPRGGVILDANGALYGTLGNGGNGGGAVFKLQRLRRRWKETMLYNFCSRDYCADGRAPNGLVPDQAGNLYGTTVFGGINCPHSGCGIAFKLTPSVPVWKETVLHSFGAYQNDGLFPNSNLALDAQGNLYGVTSAGGTYGKGTIFEITP